MVVLSRALPTHKHRHKYIHSISHQINWNWNIQFMLCDSFYERHTHIQLGDSWRLKIKFSHFHVKLDDTLSHHHLWYQSPVCSLLRLSPPPPSGKLLFHTHFFPKFEFYQSFYYEWIRKTVAFFTRKLDIYSSKDFASNFGNVLSLLSLTERCLNWIEKCVPNMQIIFRRCVFFSANTWVKKKKLATHMCIKLFRKVQQRCVLITEVANL